MDRQTWKLKYLFRCGTPFIQTALKILMVLAQARLGRDAVFIVTPISLCEVNMIILFPAKSKYIFLHAIIGRNGFEEEQNLPRDNFSLSAIRLLSAERSEARHV